MSRPVYRIQRQHSSAARSDTSDVFADRHALDDVDSQHTDTMSRRSSTASEDLTSIAAYYFDEPTTVTAEPRRQSRSSIRKSRGFLENPFSHEDDNRQYGVGPSASTRLRPQTTGSTYADESSFANSHSGYSQGPSHDYARYAQSTTGGPLTRTPTTRSTMTTQTTGHQSLHGPAHPYNMYPQNVEDLDDGASTVVGSSALHPTNIRIPVGFMGQHRFRHDSDNLSEQLPPYSEYPEDGAPKHIVAPSRLSEVPTPSIASSSTTVVPMTRGPQSMSDTNPSLALPSPVSQASLIPHEPRNMSWRQKSWKEKRKTKVCGVIPCGWIMLAVGVLLFIVVVCASVIGAIAHHWLKDAEKAAMMNNQTLVGAQSIQSNIPIAPVGSYSLQLGSAQSEDQCVTQSAQATSWSCGISAPWSMALNIANGPGGQWGNLYKAANTTLGYGTELGQTTPSKLRQVIDNEMPNMGPAWQFQVMYTKTVIARPSDLLPASVSIPGVPAPTPSSSSQSDITKRFWEPPVQPGDQPWFCYWNYTILEVFIYVDQNSTSWYGQSNTTSLHQDWHGHSKNHHKRQSSTVLPGQSEGLGQVNANMNSMSSVSSTSTTAGPASATQGSESETGSSSPGYGNGGGGGYHFGSTDLPFYPLVVKVEERRIPGDTSAPFCQKMLIQSDGTPVPIMQQGKPIITTISEQSPSLSAFQNANPDSYSKVKRKQVAGACNCEWLSGQGS